ncbi:MAG: HxsD-like protein [Ruminococcus sp.]|nr:HxsD-like protein [Ruminococcus sp.]
MNELFLSEEVYPLNAVKMAVNAFSEIAAITVEEGNSVLICSFNMLKSIPVDICMSEFEKYLIDLINSEKLYETD